MNCPKCGHKGKVEESATDGKVTYRRRLCTHCKSLFWTTERISQNPEKVEAKIRRLRQARQNEMRGMKHD